jgi:membrane fusion protein (multidrug efflux system)
VAGSEQGGAQVKRWILCFAAGLIISLLPSAGYRNLFVYEGHASDRAVSKSNSAKTDSNGPVASVQTVPLKKGTIMEHIVVYGSVIAAPGALQTVSIPFESQVLSIMVNEGQKVSKGDTLLKIQPSPDTMLQLNQAKNAYELAKLTDHQVESQHNLKLATNEQVLQAKQVLDQAKLRLESMKNRGIDGKRKITSRVGGLIKKIHVQEGSIVAAGNAIMDIVAQNRVEVLLGVEPEDIERVQTGQAVSLTRVNAPASPEVTGKVRRISYAINPTTRLVDVFIELTSPVGFLLGESIEGKIVMTSAEGLIVPRSAVLPEGNRYVLFTVKHGRAVKHTVEIGIENAKEYQVMGKDLQAGEDVVVLGNYELTNGMPVTTEAFK